MRRCSPCHRSPSPRSHAMSPSDLTVVPDAPAEGYYCPGCGTKYDTPGICTGPVESGHQPLAVVAVTDETATTETSAVKPDAPEEISSAPDGSAAADISTLKSRVSSLESS